MLEILLIDAAAILGLLHLVGPLAVHATFRFSAHCKPRLVSLDELSPTVSERILPLVPKLENLGFEFLGCYDFGEVASHTGKIMAYFYQGQTNDFANVTVSSTPGAIESYLEFSTRFSNGLTLETNTNGVLPLTPGNPEIRVFRFSETREPRALYLLHRQLIDKYAAGTWAVPEPKGQEISRVTRAMENYGPRHEKLGYMQLSSDGASYRLTWKGAALMAWRGLWPTSMIRAALYRQAMHGELVSLEVRGITALQKA